MIRRIITIDTEKCTGCALCVNACHEGAIGLRDGKAVLLREDYCDGLGDCLPACPADAIHFEEREAAAYDHEAVQSILLPENMLPQADVRVLLLHSSVMNTSRSHRQIPYLPLLHLLFLKVSFPSGRFRLNLSHRMRLISTAVICSLPQIVPLTLTAISIRHLSKTISPL